MFNDKVIVKIFLFNIYFVKNLASMFHFTLDKEVAGK